MDFKSTLNLPDPEWGIPMKADLATREPQILADWDAAKLYHQIQEKRKDKPLWVLHDGPPYTNSPIHLGTALNKVLKDFVVKSRSMMGFRAPYVPGFDNHGLPIEQAVMKKFHEQKITPDTDTLRKACREHAAIYIKLQTEQFSRLGIFGLWEKPYCTMDYRFEASILRVFKKLVESGQVYRGLKPVMWSPTSRTALADTEIIYLEHTSRAIYVKFPLLDDYNGWSEGFDNVSTIIWTTTPWTIPANLAVAFNPKLDYALVRVGNDNYLLLSELVGKVMAEIGVTDYVVEKEFLGTTFEHSKFKHPIFDRESLGVLAEYVTTEDGTGVVHTAPGHGRDDFYTGTKYGLPVLCPVNDRGILTEEAGEFAGVSYKDCDTVVTDRLRELGMLLHDAPYVHQYPHAERDERPVIFRATEQWFVSMEDNDLRPQMLAEIDKVKFIPESGYKRFRGMIANRPDWCISRQRPWGVGIPVVYGAESGIPVLDPSVIELAAQLVDEGGSDAWYTTDVKDILPAGYKHQQTGETEFRKETDVFDVWFDSGSTSIVVLEGEGYPEWKQKWPADMYLEGSDQHRGWFNLSMVIGTGVHGQAPFRQLVTHGFVNDETGRKMSKRLGNVIDPVAVCNEMGADVLRYWCASIDFEDDVACSSNILKVCGDGYRKVRNTFKFLLSNLKGFDESMVVDKLEPIDQWIVDQTKILCAAANTDYGNCEFRKVLSAVHNFCTNEISAFYADAIKDRMYCDGEDWPSRRSAQTACFHVLRMLVKIFAPVLPFTCEETYRWLPIKDRLSSVHLEVFELPTESELAEIGGSENQVRFEHLLAVRADVFAKFEIFKAESAMRNSQDVVLNLRDSEEQIKALQAFEPYELANLMKMSWVNLSVGEPMVSFEESQYLLCERSRLRRPDAEVVNDHVLTQRDRKVLGW